MREVLPAMRAELSGGAVVRLAALVIISATRRPDLTPLALPLSRPGVTIGRYAFVGAGAVVNRNVPNHALVVGNPGKVIGLGSASAASGSQTALNAWLAETFTYKINQGSRGGRN